MPSADSSERRGTKANQVGSGAPPSEPEQLQCPRCESTNTKFCYYNNYNFSQPRHFCKSCRRYWTHGGTLRDIPVGGGSRKNAKRSRTVASAAASSAFSFSSSTSTYEHRHTQATTSQLLTPLGVDHGGAVPLISDAKSGVNACGSFTSLLNTQGPGFFALGGFGVGLGAGVEDMGFGLARAVWPFPGLGVGEGGPTGVGGPSVLGNTWQLQSGEAGIVGGDCFTLSDVAISTAGHGMKRDVF
ncbi:unnamed protein product [Coffea canephora]|uniref:Dof zinc finger protein n=2 Tax=Coffea TaxID=13442 RepID=A0A068U1M8_COFCA|nr:dof zinc finger protein DOF3.4-like [Coffea arabica]CDP02450.1 unnamed protein product [Coffea canephora]